MVPPAPSASRAFPTEVDLTPKSLRLLAEASLATKAEQTNETRAANKKIKDLQAALDKAQEKIRTMGVQHIKELHETTDALNKELHRESFQSLRQYAAVEDKVQFLKGSLGTLQGTYDKLQATLADNLRERDEAVAKLEAQKDVLAKVADLQSQLALRDEAIDLQKRWLLFLFGLASANSGTAAATYKTQVEGFRPEVVAFLTGPAPKSPTKDAPP